MANVIAVVSVLAGAAVALGTQLISRNASREQFVRETRERRHDNLRDVLDAAVQALSQSRDALISIRAALERPDRDVDFLREVGITSVGLDEPDSIRDRAHDLERYDRHKDRVWEEVTEDMPKQLAALDVSLSRVRAEHARLLVRLSGDPVVMVYESGLAGITEAKTELSWRGPAALRDRSKHLIEYLRSADSFSDSNLKLLGSESKRLVGIEQ